MSFQLRPYQYEALEAIRTAHAAGVRRQFVVLPTGTGKTVLFSHLHEALVNPYPMLVLAHREELLEQAAAKIHQANPGLSVEIEQGSRYAQRPDVVVASVASLGRADGRRIGRFERDYFSAIVVDEAHHAAAPSYGRVLDYFGDAFRIGFTATPQRTDNTRLTDIFDEVVFYRSIIDMIHEGWLCPLVGYRLTTSVDLSRVRIVKGDFAEGELSSAVNIDARNEMIVDAYEEFLPGRQTIVFCVDVAHAYAVAAHFEKRGIRSACVVGSTPTDERRGILSDFRDQRTQVLTNCMVLTEGFDEPAVSGIIMARPTQSSLLYTQAVGRGTRLHEAKSDCTVIDIADVTRGRTPVGLPSLMGLPSDFDLEGEQLDEVATKYEKLSKTAPGEIVRVRSLKDIDAAWEKIDLFRMPDPDPAVLAYSSFIWITVGEDHWSLGLGDRGSLHITTDPLGRYVVMCYGATNEQIAVCATVQDAFVEADTWVREHASDKIALLFAAAGWRADPATDKQKRALRRFGVPITAELTKGHASFLLDKLYKDNPKPQWLKNKIQSQRSTF